MPEKPKILQVVLDMRSEGFSDSQIIDNLRQLGLSDDQIKSIMDLADKDVYSKFKREMGEFVTKKLAGSQEVITGMVDEAVARRLESIKKDVTGETERIVGDFAKTVNEKTSDMALAMKKVREENLRLAEETKLNRTDIDLLLAGPSRLRLIVSMFFLSLGVIIIAYTIFFVTPRVIALDFTELSQGVISMIMGGIFVIFAIVCLTVGVYFSGKPGRS
jgi:hypothetical protein